MPMRLAARGEKGEREKRKMNAVGFNPDKPLC
jgi:hypothetical protein